MSSQEVFFRRTLPPSCISFSSEEGKAIFAEALASGHMNCYFKLASQFRTQDEPAFCGLSTLVMVLNALDIDPGVVWKHPWRWYHEKMLTCCVPLNVIEQKGINLEQFACIAECNSLHTTILRPWVMHMSEDAFRNVVKDYSQRDDSFIVATYSRKVLGQTGDGHFSPIAGYHPGRDLVLIMDTARFKYPPHWIELPLLLQAMNALDSATGLPRGYIILNRKVDPALLLFRISSNLTLVLHSQLSSDILSFLQKWQAYLQESTNQDSRETVDKLVSLSTELIPEYPLLESQHMGSYCPCELPEDHEKHICTIYKLLEELEKTKIFSLIREVMNLKQNAVQQTNILASSFCNKCRKSSTGFGSDVVWENTKSQQIINLHSIHILTMLFLAWPYCTKGERSVLEKGQEQTVKQFLSDFVRSQLTPATGLLAMEAMALSRQLSVILRVLALQQSKV